MLRLLAATLASLATATAAHAHPGHGAAPFHMHATDTSGFLMVAVLAGIALWFSREE